MLATANPVLVFVTLLAACVWLGGFVAIVVVTRVARAQLERPMQVAFFRALGRAYGIVGTTALVVALGCGAALLSTRPWDGLALAAVLLGAAIALALAAGVVQARGMTRLRRRAVGAPSDGALADQVRRGARRAAVLRAAIGALSVALLAVSTALIS